MQNCTDQTLRSNSALRSAYVATPNFGNYSSILKLCCHGAPVAEYSYDSCMVYCNVTLPATIDEVKDCVSENVKDMHIAIMAGNTTEPTPSHTTSTASATHSPTVSPSSKPAEGRAVRNDGLGKVAWMVFGLGILGAFGGLL